MAKVPFSKLQIKLPVDVVKLTHTNAAGEEVSYEVKTYLPFTEKLELVSRIINQSTDENGYYNPMRVKFNTVVEIVYAYTNLSFTEKMKEDPFKLYDLLISSNIFDNIVNAIGDKEYEEINNSIWDTIKNIYEYKNSAMGILDTLSADYNNLNLDAEAIKEKIGDPENLALLRSIMTKLG